MSLSSLLNLIHSFPQKLLIDYKYFVRLQSSASVFHNLLYWSKSIIILRITVVFTLRSVGLLKQIFRPCCFYCVTLKLLDLATYLFATCFVHCYISAHLQHFSLDFLHLRASFRLISAWASYFFRYCAASLNCCQQLCLCERHWLLDQLDVGDIKC